MGLFASRAQQPFDWAGLPSEPLAPRSDAEFLKDPPADPFAITGAGTTASITIAVPTGTTPSPDAPATPDDGR